MHEEVVQLCCALIEKQSITPDDAGCQELIAQRLGKYRFSIQHLPFGRVQNMWALREGSGDAKDAQARTLVFLGHTDVVPPGDEKAWRFPPFEPHIEADVLYGRGVVDMKGAVAAFLVACEHFLQEEPETPLRLAILLTSCEEESSDDGIKRVALWLDEQGERCPFILVGEPSSHQKAGDCIKKGRRGSLSGHMALHGTQGHVAYLDPSLNTIHRFIKAAAPLLSENWGPPIDVFPAAQLQFTDVKAGVPSSAGNVAPSTLECQFNFRFGPNVAPETLQERFSNFFSQEKVTLRWHVSGRPFLSQEGLLARALRASIPIQTTFAADGGTSDGRFLARPDREIMELGLCGQWAHRVDERAPLKDIETLTNIYFKLLKTLSASIV